MTAIQLFLLSAMGLLLWLTPAQGAAPPAEFANFESATVHGLDLSPSKRILAVCNLPDGRVEFYSTTNGVLRALGGVRVGIDPVSVRFKSEDEVWVVNHISQSINVVDVSNLQLSAIIQTTPRPTDVVFAGSPQKAFLAASFRNQLEVFDAATFEKLGDIPIQGERPTALAASADGKTVYCTIKESGNQTTILARKLVPLHRPSVPGAVEDRHGPHGGVNPPPNAGREFEPPIKPTNTPPQVSLIVRKSSDGRWMDDNNGDWTEYISGTNAHLSGRIEGWDMLDHDLAIISADTHEVGYVDTLMTICLAVGINPQTGQVSVVGTEHLNQIRFEPRLKGIFARVQGAIADPGSKTKKVFDLNPHLDYQTSSVPAVLREQSLGDPRAIVWNAAGTRAYVAGRGSDNIIVLDAEGGRVGQATPVGEGPEALALDDVAGRLYVLNRFEGSISVITTPEHKTVQTVRLFDPTPAEIKEGRRHLYNTHSTSGLGHLSCATCHVDARFDRLAWDLGNPSGEMKALTAQQRLNSTGLKPAPFAFHPMKGPMVTQSMQDLIGHEPFHWLGDRKGIEEFGATFRDLQGTEEEFGVIEMRELKAFLRTIMYPPTPDAPLTFEEFTSMPLPGFFALGRGALPRGAPLPNGSVLRGQALSRSCVACHTEPSGLGSEAGLSPGRTDTNGNHFLHSATTERAESLFLKVPGFRNLRERTGFRLDSATSTAGFGFLHDGRVDTLERLVQEGSDDNVLNIKTDQELADMVAFLLAPGSRRTLQSGNRPAPPTHGGDPILGRQFSLRPFNARELVGALRQMMGAGAELELMLQATLDGVPRSWAFDQNARLFRSDRKNETLSTNALPASVESNISFVLMPVAPGTSKRLGLDRDSDQLFDGDELLNGFDPGDPSSLPYTVRLEQVAGPPPRLRLSWPTVRGETYRIEQSTNVSWAGSTWSPLHEERASGTTMQHEHLLTGESARDYFRIVRVPWNEFGGMRPAAD